jgi:predicted small metal-binding protein
MQMEVTCRCGWVTRGTRQEVISSVQAHGRTAHQQEITPAQVRAIWRTVEAGGAKK